MAFGRLQRSPRPVPMSDINMTPLIDVMLVLLVIFIIAAPLMGTSLKLDLPRSDAATPSDNPAFISVSIDDQGQLFIGSVGVSAVSFKQQIAQAAAKNPDTEVQLRADVTVPYGHVVQLVGTVQQMGLNRIAFVAEHGSKPGQR
jgi:biopolymer transport protein ExbD